jgi:hypothetical protein
MQAKPKVVVLGGGFGGLESAFYLRYKLGEKVDLTVVSDRDHFLFKPNTIYIPFGAAPEQWHLPLEKPMRRKHMTFIQAQVQAIDPECQTVQVAGAPLAYDYLVVATGADMRPQETPGLQDHALTVWTELALVRLRTRFQQLLDQVRRGVPQQLLFLVSPNNRCSGPLYEMVLMTDTWLRRQQQRQGVDITWTTCEDAFIQAFGPRLHTVVAEKFAERGIHGHTGFVRWSRAWSATRMVSSAPMISWCRSRPPSPRSTTRPCR